jgi:hypothetical protein
MNDGPKRDLNPSSPPFGASEFLLADSFRTTPSEAEPWDSTTWFCDFLSFVE